MDICARLRFIILFFFFVIIYEQVENSYRVVIIWIYTFRAIKMNKQLKKKI